MSNAHVKTGEQILECMIVILTESASVDEHSGSVAADTDEEGDCMHPHPCLYGQTDHDPLCEHEAGEGDGNNVEELVIEQKKGAKHQHRG